MNIYLNICTIFTCVFHHLVICVFIHLSIDSIPYPHNTPPTSHKSGRSTAKLHQIATSSLVDDSGRLATCQVGWRMLMVKLFHGSVGHFTVAIMVTYGNYTPKYRSLPVNFPSTSFNHFWEFWPQTMLIWIGLTIVWLKASKICESQACATHWSNISVATVSIVFEVI